MSVLTSIASPSLSSLRIQMRCCHNNGMNIAFSKEVSWQRICVAYMSKVTRRRTTVLTKSDDRHSYNLKFKKGDNVHDLSFKRNDKSVGTLSNERHSYKMKFKRNDSMDSMRKVESISMKSIPVRPSISDQGLSSSSYVFGNRLNVTSERGNCNDGGGILRGSSTKDEKIKEHRVEEEDNDSNVSDLEDDVNSEIPLWKQLRNRRQLLHNSPWNPKKKLTREQINDIRTLHSTDKVKYSRRALSVQYGISFEAVYRILRSKFEPSQDREAKQTANAKEVHEERRRKGLACREELERYQYVKDLKAERKAARQSAEELSERLKEAQEEIAQLKSSGKNSNISTAPRLFPAPSSLQEYTTAAPPLFQATPTLQDSRPQKYATQRTFHVSASFETSNVASVSLGKSHSITNRVPEPPLEWTKSSKY